MGAAALTRRPTAVSAGRLAHARRGARHRGDGHPARSTSSPSRCRATPMSIRTCCGGDGPARTGGPGRSIFVLADGKMRGLFTMLFGASTAAGRRARRGRRARAAGAGPLRADGALFGDRHAARLSDLVGRYPGASMRCAARSRFARRGAGRRGACWRSRRSLLVGAARDRRGDRAAARARSRRAPPRPTPRAARAALGGASRAIARCHAGDRGASSRRYRGGWRAMCWPRAIAVDAAHADRHPADLRAGDAGADAARHGAVAERASSRAPGRAAAIVAVARDRRSASRSRSYSPLACVDRRQAGSIRSTLLLTDPLHLVLAAARAGARLCRAGDPAACVRARRAGWPSGSRRRGGWRSAIISLTPSLHVTLLRLWAGLVRRISTLAALSWSCSASGRDAAWSQPWLDRFALRPVRMAVAQLRAAASSLAVDATLAIANRHAK